MTLLHGRLCFRRQGNTERSIESQNMGYIAKMTGDQAT